MRESLREGEATFLMCSSSFPMYSPAHCSNCVLISWSVKYESRSINGTMNILADSLRLFVLKTILLLWNCRCWFGESSVRNTAGDFMVDCAPAAAGLTVRAAMIGADLAVLTVMSRLVNVTVLLKTGRTLTPLRHLETPPQSRHFVFVCFFSTLPAIIPHFPPRTS